MNKMTLMYRRTALRRKALAVTRLMFVGLVAGFAVAILLPGADAIAHSYKLDDIAVGHVWAPLSGSGVGVPVYGPILNEGDTPVTLAGASSPIAREVRFRTVNDGKVSWPRSIELPPGKPLGLAKWREHIWLTGLQRPLKEGDTFDMTLDFGDKGRLTVKVVVEAAAGH